MGTHVGLMRDSCKIRGTHGPKSFVLLKEEVLHQKFRSLTILLASRYQKGVFWDLYGNFGLNHFKAAAKRPFCHCKRTGYQQYYLLKTIYVPIGDTQEYCTCAPKLT